MIGTVLRVPLCRAAGRSGFPMTRFPMQHSSRLPVLLLPLALFAFLLAYAGAVDARALPEFTELVKESSPSVVNISTSKTRTTGSSSRRQPPNPFEDFFAPEREEEEESGPRARPYKSESLGSGVIIEADGYIITNYHVVEDAQEILVRLSDRRQYDAEVVGYDRGSDLALLKIDAEDLPVARIGDSTDLEVGSWVLAIGSPFGFEHSATAGIISAKQRSLPRENYVPFLQTDVAINPGNSGGPLYNLDGEVVGINSHIYSRSGGFMGLSFAIPIELAMNVVTQLREDGKVTRAWLGVLVQEVDRELAESFDMDRAYGALVARVVSGGPGSKAGLEEGDIIVSFDGQEIPTSSALPPMVGRMPVDHEARVEVIREGELREVTVMLAALPDQSVRQRGQAPLQEEQPETADAHDRLGITVRELTDEERAELDLDEGGVLIEEVGEGPAQEGSLVAQDVITMLNQKRVDSLDTFNEIVSELPTGRSVPILVHRDGGPRFFALRLSDDD